MKSMRLSGAGKFYYGNRLKNNCTHDMDIFVKPPLLKGGVAANQCKIYETGVVVR